MRAVHARRATWSTSTASPAPTGPPATSAPTSSPRNTQSHPSLMGRTAGRAYDHGMRACPLVCIAWASAGCGITDFEIDQPIPEQRVQGSGIPAPLAVLFPLPLDLDLSAEIRKQTTGPIDSVNLTSLTLSITATDRGAGDTDDWSFVDEIHVFVASSMSGSSLPRVEIASTVAP